jgi:phage N-6-adenine-methyltransferase
MDSVHVMLARPLTDVWETPAWIFEALDREFGFSLDPCCDRENATCKKFFTAAENGLLRSWGTETVFMNPPHSQIKWWMRKAFMAAQEGALVVCLVPARTDTHWWHDYAMKGEIRFIRGRLRFGDRPGRAPFPSSVVIFRPRSFQMLTFSLPNQL